MTPLAVDGRLELRALEPGHVPAMFSLIDANRARLREWMPWVDAAKSIRDTRSFVSAARQATLERVAMHAGMWYDGELCGAIGIHHIDAINRRGEVGYWVCADLEGQGVVTRACRRLIRYAFEDLSLNRVEIRCDPRNSRSRSIPLRLGFREEGTLRDAQWINGRFVDLVVYGLLHREWAVTAGATSLPAAGK